MQAGGMLIEVCVGLQIIVFLDGPNCLSIKPLINSRRHGRLAFANFLTSNSACHMMVIKPFAHSLKLGSLILSRIFLQIRRSLWLSSRIHHEHKCGTGLWVWPCNIPFDWHASSQCSNSISRCAVSSQFYHAYGLIQLCRCLHSSSLPFSQACHRTINFVTWLEGLVMAPILHPCSLFGFVVIPVHRYVFASVYLSS